MQTNNVIKMSSEITEINNAANDVLIENKTLAQSVSAVLQNYFSLLDGEYPTDLYQKILNEIEPALLEKTLIYTRGNQTKAAILLGVSRGTLRKKLAQYRLEKFEWRNKRPPDMRIVGGSKRYLSTNNAHDEV